MKRKKSAIYKLLFAVTVIVCTLLLPPKTGLEEATAAETDSETELTLPASGDCGNGVTWMLDENGLLAIAGTGNIPDYTDGAPWYPYRKLIKEITFGKDVTGIGARAFESCINLKSVTIPDTIKSIGQNAFFYCKNMETARLPESGLDSFGTYVFQDCKSLGSITIPASYAMIPEGTFKGCSGLTEVTLTDSITAIRTSAFSDCTGLGSITLPDSVSDIGQSAFSGCSSLSAISLPESIQVIKSKAFSDCTSLESVQIPETVYTIDYMAFENCTSLVSITLPKEIRYIGKAAFRNCTNLATIVMPDAFTQSDNGISIEEYAFTGCESLTELTIPAGWILGEYAFSWCSGLETVSLADGVKSVGDYAFSWCSGLTRLNILGTMPAIGENVFFCCNDQLAIYVRDSAQTLSPEELSVNTGTATANIGHQTYFQKASPVDSYLVMNSDGTKTRVEYTGYKIEINEYGYSHLLRDRTYVTAEKYDSQGNLLEKKYIALELPLFGGYYAGEDYNLLVFGKENENQDNSAEVIRVVKYTKDWEKVDSVSLYGLNTTTPFTGGTL